MAGNNQIMKSDRGESTRKNNSVMKSDRGESTRKKNDSVMNDSVMNRGCQKTYRPLSTAWQHSTKQDFRPGIRDLCLKDADSNHELANILYTITDNAHDTCDDRVALSVIYLGLQQALNEYKKSIGSNLPYVYNLLINGFLTIELLSELARYKVAASQNIDEIEVYLGYLIKTKKVLEIPINLNEMVFPDLANLSSDDVAVAVERVQKMRNDSQTCHQFLIQQPIWIDILTNKFKDAVETITNTRNKNDDYVEALNTYTKSMVELSIHCYRSDAASSNPGEVATQNTRQAVEHDIQNWNFNILRILKDKVWAKPSTATIPCFYANMVTK